MRFITWGMMVSRDRKSCSPILEISIPSIRIRPPALSRIRNNAKVRVDLPAPVRPTIPTCFGMKKREGLCKHYESNKSHKKVYVKFHQTGGPILPELNLVYLACFDLLLLSDGIVYLKNSSAFLETSLRINPSTVYIAEL